MRSVLLLALVSTLCAVDANLENGVMARGYDVVAYTTSQALAGDAAITAEHHGATYRFATTANRDTFLADPDRYVPAYGGWCAYAMADGDLVNIDPETYKLIDGRVYLFYNGFWGNTLTKWNKDETALKTKADAAWQQLNAEP